MNLVTKVMFTCIILCMGTFLRPAAAASSTIRVVGADEFTKVCDVSIAWLATITPKPSDIAVFDIRGCLEKGGFTIYNGWDEGGVVYKPVRAFYNACKAKKIRCIFVSTVRDKSHNDIQAKQHYETLLKQAGYTGYEKIIFPSQEWAKKQHASCMRRDAPDFVGLFQHTERQKLIDEGSTILCTVGFGNIGDDSNCGRKILINIIERHEENLITERFNIPQPPTMPASPSHVPVITPTAEAATPSSSSSSPVPLATPAVPVPGPLPRPSHGITARRVGIAAGLVLVAVGIRWGWLKYGHRLPALASKVRA